MYILLSIAASAKNKVENNTTYRRFSYPARIVFRKVRYIFNGMKAMKTLRK